MFKIISQVVILIIFLFLTIFVTVWFNDTNGDETAGDSRQSISWFSEAIKTTSSVLGAFLPKEEKNNDPNINEAVVAESNFVSEISEKYNNVSNSASEYIDNTEGENEFRNFVGGIIERSPKYYLDVKLYNNTWQKFWSFYWLKYKEAATGEE